MDIRLPEKKEFKLSWREAGPLIHFADKVDLDQKVVNKKLFLCSGFRVKGLGFRARLRSGSELRDEGSRVEG